MQSSNHRIPRWYAGFTFFILGVYTAHDGDYGDVDGSGNDSRTSQWRFWSHVTLRWQELPRACLPQLMSRRKMMNRKNTAEKIEKQPRVKSNALYLYSDIYWQFTAGSISAIQLSIWKVIKKTREDDTDYIHLPQFSLSTVVEICASTPWSKSRARIYVIS